jgi:hypothetical protein
MYVTSLKIQKRWARKLAGATFEAWDMSVSIIRDEVRTVFFLLEQTRQQTGQRQGSQS